MVRYTHMILHRYTRLELTLDVITDDHSFADTVPHLVARQDWKDSDMLKVHLEDNSVRYISYGALKRDSVPCSRRGHSFYNCHPGAEAHKYQRGCSPINHCRAVNEADQ